MAITSQDIHNQSFAIDRKGYDVDEVDVFLERVAEEIDSLNETIGDLRSELQSAKEKAEAGSHAAKVKEEEIESSAMADDAMLSAELAEKDSIIEDLEAQLAEKRANDSAISSALIVAQRSADEIIVKANAQASEAIQDARDEADRIIKRANSDKQNVLDAIRKLEDDRESAREDYADLLRNLIEDASTKLNKLGYDDDIDNIPGIGRDAKHIDVVYEEDSSETVLPAEAAVPLSANHMQINSVVAKDLSGYGDVEDSFEDVD